MSRDQSEDALEDKVVRALKAESLIRDRAGLRGGAGARIGAVAAILLIAAMLAAIAALYPRPAGEGGGETYMLALYDGPGFQAAPAGGSRAAEYGDWARMHGEGAAAVIGGEELGPPAAVLGPAGAGDPTLAGYFLVRAPSQNEAVAVARTSPHIRYGGTIVVRRVRNQVRGPAAADNKTPRQGESRGACL